MNHNIQGMSTGLSEESVEQAFWEYVGTCTARGRVSERTRSVYGAGLREWVEYCRSAQVGLRQATRPDVEAFRATLSQRGQRARTIAVRLAAVRVLYRALQRAGAMDANPADGVKAPRAETAPVDAVMRKIIFPDQMMVLLNSLDDGTLGRRDRVIFLLMYLLGLRVSEVAGLRIEQIKGGSLNFTAKGSRERSLAVPQALQDALEQYLAGKQVGPLFPGHSGPYISARAIQKMVQVRMSAAGIEQRSPHAFRHSCATVSAINGASAYAIQDLLGHESQKTTSIYTNAAGRFLESPSHVLARALQAAV